MKQHNSFFAAIAILTLFHIATARDLRTVTEPKTPETCTSLIATGGDDTKLIQNALDSCVEGKAVALASGTFNSGPLTIPSGVNLLVEEGVILESIPDPKLYDKGSNICGTIDDLGVGCKAFITISGAKGSGIYGKGMIQGQGYAVINTKKVTWFKLNKVAIERGRRPNSPSLVEITDSVDITVYQVTLTNSALYHITSNRTVGLTVWGIAINSPMATVMSYGVVIDGSRNVTIAYSRITTVDDDVHIVGKTAPTQYVSVYENHVGSGNGLAIGSHVDYGVSHVTFSNMTLNALSNGLRIKTNTLDGGPVSDIRYENICMYRVRFPINIDTSYGGLTGGRLFMLRNIDFNNIHVGSSGSFIFQGLSEHNPITISINGLHFTVNSTWSIANTHISGSLAADHVRPSSCTNFKY
uniref:Glycoside hydrolase family 28 n=1 Tax=Medauroidea extradentata TaxID=614211 RepID=A0A191XT16_9NEOP|nr:glycoside hydrolase family 28 [Medauroidea extradentata]